MAKTSRLEPKLKWKRGKVPASMFTAMGHLVASAAIAEMRLGSEILRLISMGRPISYAYPIIAGMEAKTKISLVRIFVKMFQLDPDGYVNELLDRISALFDRRNEIAHSVIQMDPKNSKRFKFQDLRAKVRSGEMPQAQVRTSRELNDYAKDLVKQCQFLEMALTARGMLAFDEFHKAEKEILSAVIRTAQSEDQDSPDPTKHKTHPKPRSTKGPDRT